MEDGYVHEVPSSLKQLARLIARAFYSIEDALIIDMLVRNPCMKEDDICDLLKFERKMLRGKIATLKNDKFLQTRLKMETIDSKSTKVNYYYINYKTFVNIVKYKLDQMRKRMETSERDATSRSSFHCPNCKKKFTDYDAHHLIDPTDPTGDFRCTFCRTIVEEDQTSLPKNDSRMMMARFNEQMAPLYSLLSEVEDVKLAPSLLEPEPTDISHLQRDADGKLKNVRKEGELWSGEASRGGGFQVEEQRVDITIGDNVPKKVEVRKEVPIWMAKSTIIAEANVDSNDSLSASGGMFPEVDLPGQSKEKTSSQADVISVLFQMETAKEPVPVHKVESSDDEASREPIPSSILQHKKVDYGSDVELMESDGDDPMVRIGNEEYPFSEVDGNAVLIARMTPAEKDAYVDLYQKLNPDDDF